MLSVIQISTNMFCYSFLADGDDVDDGDNKVNTEGRRTKRKKEAKSVSVHDAGHDVNVSGAGEDLVRRKSPRLRLPLNEETEVVDVGSKEGDFS